MRRLIMLALILSGAAHADDRIKTGLIAICETKADAQTLLDKMAEGGRPAGIEWMREPDNTCSLQQATFKMGDPIGVPKLVEGEPWTIIHISPPAGGSSDFSVVPVSALVLTGA